MKTRWVPAGCKYQTLQIKEAGRWLTTAYEVRRLDDGTVFVAKPGKSWQSWELWRGTLSEAKRALEAECEEAQQ